MSLDEVARQEMIFWRNKPCSKEWFGSWQFKVAASNVGSNGCIFYAMPAGTTTRFSDEEVIRAELRMRTAPTLNGRKELISILNTVDQGNGDVDDVIGKYEDDPGH